MNMSRRQIQLRLTDLITIGKAGNIVSNLSLEGFAVKSLPLRAIEARHKTEKLGTENPENC